MKNKNVFILALTLVFSSFTLSGERLGELSEVLKPQMIRVFGQHLYVVEGHKIFHYNMPDLKFLGHIGKEGEGPGEFQLDPSRTLIVSVIEKELRAESRTKLAVFSLEGTFLREEHKPPTVLQTLPLGKNRLTHYIRYEDDGRAFFILDLIDPEGKTIKELYRQKFFQFGSSVYTIADGLNFIVTEDRVWVEKSPEGFSLECFDSQGNSIRKVSHQIPLIKVHDNDQVEAKDRYLKIPFLYRMRKEQGDAALKAYLSQLTFEYPETFPPIKHLKWEGERMLALTYDRNAEGELHYVLDCDGKMLGSVRLPQAQDVDFLVSMQGDKQHYDVHQGFFYYLRTEASEDDENWAIHRCPIQIGTKQNR